VTRAALILAWLAVIVGIPQFVIGFLGACGGEGGMTIRGKIITL